MGKRFRELTQTATDADFAEGNYFGVDTPSVTKKLPANLVAKASEQAALTTYAQNVAHSIAPEFDPTRTSENPYKVGEYVMYEGVRRRFISPHYGAWNSLDAVTEDVSIKQQEIYSKVNKLGLETVGESKVFEFSVMWTNPQLNAYKRIGKQFAEKTLKFLVSCENPPVSSCNIYFSETSASSSVISSATLTATIGVPIEGEVPANANYIWLFSSTSSLTDKPVNLSLFETSEQSLKSSIETLQTKTGNISASIAPEFDPTRTSDNPYKANERVMYQGKMFVFCNEHYGAWSNADVVEIPLCDSVSTLESKVKKVEFDLHGKSEVVSFSSTWDTNLNSIKKIGSSLVGRSVKLLVSCENPPVNNCTVYFSSGTTSGSIISSETCYIGIEKDAVVPSGTQYIWLFKSNSASTPVKVRFGLYETTNEESVDEKLASISEELEEDGLKLDKLNLFVGNLLNVTYNADKVIIEKKLNSGLGESIEFARFGVNNLLQLKRIAIRSSDLQLVSVTTGTDSVGPYQVGAVNNIDGDNLTASKFTGGCHGYNGDQTGSATASGTFKVFADGNEIADYSTFDCVSLKIEVVNNIQGWNTRKEDGSGRAIIREKVLYELNAGRDEIKVNNEIEALEDVVFSLYYGMQIAFARDFVKYKSELKEKWFLKSESSSYSGDNLYSVVAKSNANLIQEMGVDYKGLGCFNYVPDNIPKAFQSDKIYYNLIRTDVSVEQAEALFFKAFYRFGYAGAIPTIIKRGSYTIENSLTDKYFSVTDVPRGEYKLVVIFEGESVPANITVYSASSHVSTNIIDGYDGVTSGNPVTIDLGENENILWLFSSSTRTYKLSYYLME